MQATNGIFYGTTEQGGTGDCFGGGGCGTAFSLSIGLAPFVELQPTIGQVGTPVTILGTNLTGATSVTFNGTPATFNIVSSSEITTTVPAGATTGTVQVTVGGNNLISNTDFQVVGADSARPGHALPAGRHPPAVIRFKAARRRTSPSRSSAAAAFPPTPQRTR